MTLTIGNWIFIGLIAICGAIFTIYCFSENENTWGIGSFLITLILCVIIALGLSWWHTNTASGIRTMKDYESNMNNGIEREITITAEDGREIFYYEGRCDIETTDNYILFESEEGRRYMIYYGVQDTVLIIEKETDE